MPPESVAPVIQLSHSAARVHANDQALHALSQHFGRTGWLRLPLLLEPSLLARMLDRMDDSDFCEVRHEDMGGDRELVLRECVASRSLELLLNSETLFEFLQQVTDSGPIGSFLGRAYRFLPDSGHGYGWHSDVADTRQLGLSLNLSPQPYLGGQLQLRRLGEPDSCQDVSNTGLGDAVIFAIDEAMEHRVRPVLGAHPKTAYAGWFCRDPEFKGRIRSLDD